MNARHVPPIIALILTMLVLLAVPRPAEALLATHDCSFCHEFHGAPSTAGLLKYSSTEVLCLTCHSTINGSTDAAAVHNPRNLASNQQGYITCRECHNPHDNIAGNIKLVGYNKDPATGQSFAVPTIREELTTSDPASPVYKPVMFATMTEPADYYRHDGKGACEICHTANHLVGKDCTACHLHNNDFGGTVTPPQGFPAGSTWTCTDCHTGTGTDSGGIYSYAAYNVGPGGTHMKLKATDTSNAACTACHRGHNKTPVVLIPNNSKVGISYTANGETGISLGGDNTSGTTEAEICWNCHFGEGISEWGENTDTNGIASNYNFGDIYTNSGTGTRTANWIGAWWKSAVSTFSYKTGQIQSTHAVSDNATSPGLDPVANIRCSYCHDVHELALAPGDTKTGKPYLRGTWKGSPYKEDGAPQAKAITGFSGNWYDYFENNSSSFIFGSVPRGWGGSLGGNSPSLPNNGYDDLARPSWPEGYWIDQNTNPNPTGTGTGNTSLGWTANNSAGLCALCHGDADGSWDTTGSPNEIDQLNHFGNSADDWIGTNGHSNAVLGGSGYYKANIFDLRGGNTGDSDNPAMAFYGASDPGNGWPNLGFRNTGGAGFRPYLYGPSTWSGRDWYDYYIWGATIDNTTIDQKYHQFSCSKCHNPHASRLPRLMITNCLDTKHNTWDDDGDIPGAGDGEFGSLNQRRSISNWTSAQNCHRLGGVTDGSGPEPEDCDGRGYGGCQSGDTKAQAGTGTGWNTVTPW